MCTAGQLKLQAHVYIQWLYFCQDFGFATVPRPRVGDNLLGRGSSQLPLFICALRSTIAHRGKALLGCNPTLLM